MSGMEVDADGGCRESFRLLLRERRRKIVIGRIIITESKLKSKWLAILAR